MQPPTPLDIRIQSLTEEVYRLRKTRHQTDNQLQHLVLKLTEVQLNLATQDKTLNKLDTAINGNGKPGLTTRVDRIERITTAQSRALWLFLAAALTTALKFLTDRL